jgi:predicted ATPase
MSRRKQNVFISYARQDALDFARQLKGDIQNAGHSVFLDLLEIESGARWDVRLEQGIRQSDTLTAVMTVGSLRDDSICRDEVVFAINEGKSIVPVKLERTSDLKPPILLARRNWADFSVSYEAGLDSLLHHLAGDSSRLQAPPVPTVTGVVPLDFGPEIARLSSDFTGREWMARQIDIWLNDPSGRAFVIIGEPGIGKSAIAAWLSYVRRDQTVAIHFCTDRNSRTLDPFEFVASLVSQLCTQVGGFLDVVHERRPELRRQQAKDAFRELVVEPARLLPVPASPLLVILDSLDESMRRGGETLLDVFVNQADDLPAWLRIIATTQPDQRVLEKVRRLRTLELRADGTENQADIATYVEARLTRVGRDQHAAQRPSSLVAEQVLNLASGNFLYARMALDALESGLFKEKELGSLLPGVCEFYARSFAKIFSSEGSFELHGKRILRALSVARGPLPFTLLDRISRLGQESVETTHARLLRLKPYLRMGGGGKDSTYALFHQSLRDWLGSQEEAGLWWCSSQLGMEDLADACWQHYQNDPESTTEYVLRYAMFHLLAVGRADDAKTLRGDEVFARCRANIGLTAYFLILSEPEDEFLASRLRDDLLSRGFDIRSPRGSDVDGRAALGDEEESRNFDRVILVGGAKAMSQQRVRRQWQSALADGKPVIPILRFGEFEELPSDFKDIRIYDFRGPGRYELELGELARSLDAPLPRLARLFDVPALPPGFISRPEHMRELKASVGIDGSVDGIRSDSVWCTGLAGVGGIGKTTLLSALARDQDIRRAFPDGVFWLEVGTSPDLIRLQKELVSKLGEPVKFANEGGAKTLDLIFKRRSALVLLDEVYEATHVLALGARAARCRTVIATRDPQLVDQLGGRSVSVDPMELAEAVELFIQRATQVNAQYEPNPEELLAIRELVRMLNCLPLAIELAAARTRFMSASMLLARMGERFRLLSTSSRRGDGRKATLRAALEWSWELLSTEERLALVQLSVFEDGFTVEAAEFVVDLSVCEGAPRTRDVLPALVAKSLVRTVGPERFDILASVQEFAAERFTTAGAHLDGDVPTPSSTEGRHIAWFAGLGALRAVDGGGADLANLVVACRRAIARDDVALAVSSLEGAWAAISLRGPHSLGISLAEEVCAMPTLSGTWAARAVTVRASARSLVESMNAPGNPSHLPVD